MVSSYAVLACLMVGAAVALPGGGGGRGFYSGGGGGGGGSGGIVVIETIGGDSGYGGGGGGGYGDGGGGGGGYGGGGGGGFSIGGIGSGYNGGGGGGGGGYGGSGSGGGGYGGGGGGYAIISRPIPYVFNYGVQAGNNNFGQEEEGDGKNVKGHYYVHLPDGRLQRVDYWADESGYHATVSYEGTASYPTVSYSSASSGYGH